MRRTVNTVKTVFVSIGQYIEMLWHVVQVRHKMRPFLKQLIIELDKIGLNSVPLVLVISVFMGAVIALQTAYNLNVAIIPKYIVGLGTRDSMLLEFSSTMIALILAGTVGSNIASELGTMRITEQIDALEIMGINPASFLILPKVIASLITFPILTLMSMIIGIFGGYLATFTTDLVSKGDFIYGIHTLFHPFYITYSLIKITVFGFIISTVSSFQGYYVKGGAVEVGKASTKAVIYSDVLILTFNIILTKLLLK